METIVWWSAGGKFKSKSKMETIYGGDESLIEEVKRRSAWRGWWWSWRNFPHWWWHWWRRWNSNRWRAVRQSDEKHAEFVELEHLQQRGLMMQQRCKLQSLRCLKQLQWRRTDSSNFEVGPSMFPEVVPQEQKPRSHSSSRSVQWLCWESSTLVGVNFIFFPQIIGQKEFWCDVCDWMGCRAIPKRDGWMSVWSRKSQMGQISNSPRFWAEVGKTVRRSANVFSQCSWVGWHTDTNQWSVSVTAIYMEKVTDWTCESWWTCHEFQAQIQVKRTAASCIRFLCTDEFDFVLFQRTNFSTARCFPWKTNRQNNIFIRFLTKCFLTTCEGHCFFDGRLGTCVLYSIATKLLGKCAFRTRFWKYWHFFRSVGNHLVFAGFGSSLHFRKGWIIAVVKPLGWCTLSMSQ